MGSLYTGLTLLDDFNGQLDGTRLGDNPEGTGTTFWGDDVWGTFSDREQMGYWTSGTQPQQSNQYASTSSWIDGTPGLADQRVAITYREGSYMSDVTQMELWIRLSPDSLGAPQGYRFRWQLNFGQPEYYIDVATGSGDPYSGWYTLVSDTSGGYYPSPGDVFAFEAVGTDLTVYVNDTTTVLLAGNDNAWSTGTFAIGNQNFEIYMDDVYWGPVSSGGTGTQYTQSITLTSTATGSLRRAAGKRASLTATGATSLVRKAVKPVVLTSTTTPTVTKQGRKPLTATATGTATSSASRVFLKLLLSTVTGTASVAKRVTKLLAVTSTSSHPHLTKQATKSFTTTATGTASLSALKVVLKLLTATATGTASVARDTAKRLLTTVTGAVGATKAARKSFTTTVTGSATAQAIRAVLLVLQATATASPSLTRRASKLLGANASVAPTLRRRGFKSFVATSNVSALATKGYGLTLSTAVSVTASVGRSIGKALQIVASVLPALSLRASVSTPPQMVDGSAIVGHLASTRVGRIVATRLGRIASTRIGRIR